MEQLLVVCDECGKPAVTTAKIQMDGSTTSLQKDLCEAHAKGLKAGTHRAKRGRRAGAYA